MREALPPALESLASAFLARNPPRIWSLLVTVFGVEALPAGAAIRLADLQDWLSDIGIEAGLVRTALSRLVANGTLLREREGKAALYRLSAAAESAFHEAGQRIFGHEQPLPTGRLDLAWIEEQSRRHEIRAGLEAQGFAALAPNLMVRPQHRGRHLLPIAGVTVFPAEVPVGFSAKAGTLWPIAELAAGYRETIRAAGLLGETVAAFSPREAFLARILLVHEFRRVVLRDPVLPADMLPPDWPGAAARLAFDVAMQRIAVDLRP